AAATMHADASHADPAFINYLPMRHGAGASCVAPSKPKSMLGYRARIGIPEAMISGGKFRSQRREKIPMH
ncbi:MAG TPA: hypothetical protein VII39_00645, partial [Bradyrhizobium sp.]